MRRFAFIGLFFAFLTGMGLPASVSAAEAEMAPLADRSLLLDGDQAGARLVVVGERGHVLTSDDSGLTWTQRPVPTRATLTSVFFVNEQLGWAAGHDAVILRTTDGGATWRQVYEDRAGERPVLDLWFQNAHFGYAVGAYGLFLMTEDGGDTWQELNFEAEDLVTETADEPDDADASEGGEWYDVGGWVKDVHLNQIRQAADGRLFIAGEAGSVYRSDDDGFSWLSLDPPYEGSLFGSLSLSGDRLLVYGLRGHLLFSPDAGRTWMLVETGVSATLNDAIRLDDGRIVLVGLAGTLLVSADEGRTLTAYPQADRAGLSRVLEAGDGALVLLGTHGVRRFRLPPRQSPPPVHSEEGA